MACAQVFGRRAMNGGVHVSLRSCREATSYATYARRILLVLAVLLRRFLPADAFDTVDGLWGHVQRANRVFESAASGAGGVAAGAQSVYPYVKPRQGGPRSKHALRPQARPPASGIYMHACPRPQAGLGLDRRDRPRQ
eukprot:154388-Chlamydomonas_euryale.AAC.1